MSAQRCGASTDVLKCHTIQKKNQEHLYSIRLSSYALQSYLRRLAANRLPRKRDGMGVEPIATIPCSCSRILKAGGVVQTRSVFLKIYADREFWVLPGVLTNGNISAQALPHLPTRLLPPSELALRARASVDSMVGAIIAFLGFVLNFKNREE